MLREPSLSPHFRQVFLRLKQSAGYASDFMATSLMSRLTLNTSFNQELTEPSAVYQSLCTFWSVGGIELRLSQGDFGPLGGPIHTSLGIQHESDPNMSCRLRKQLTYSYHARNLVSCRAAARSAVLRTRLSVLTRFCAVSIAASLAK